VEAATAEAPKPKEKAKPKLRSMDEMLRLSDEHGPTFDKK
jgi:hypothetical protein